jgi:hypothetical protein
MRSEIWDRSLNKAWPTIRPRGLWTTTVSPPVARTSATSVL